VETIVRGLWPWLGDPNRQRGRRVVSGLPGDVREAVSPRTDLAWAAGLFDATGSFTSLKAGLVARLAGLDPFQLERFVLITGVGKIWGPYDSEDPSDKRPRYVYGASGHESVQVLAGLLWSWMGSAKRREAALVLSSYLAEYPCGHRRPDGRWRENCLTCA